MPKIYELDSNTDKANANWYSVVQDGAGNAMKNIPLEHLKRLRAYDEDTSGGPVTVNLDDIADWSYEGVVIRDITGDAATNNITINAGGSDTINGGSSYVISEAYGSVTIVESGPAQMIVSSKASSQPYRVAYIDTADSPYSWPDTIDHLIIDNSGGPVVVNVPGTADGLREMSAMITGDLSVETVTFQNGSGETVNKIDPWLVQDRSYENQIINFKPDLTNGTWNIYKADGRDYGEVYARSAADSTTISVVNTPVKIDAVTTDGEFNGGFTNDSSTDNRIKNETGATVNVKCSARVTMNDGGGGANDYTLYIAKNGTVENKTGQRVRVSTTNVQITSSGIIELADDDYVEAWIENNTSTDNITIEDLHLVAERIY